RSRRQHRFRAAPGGFGSGAELAHRDRADRAAQSIRTRRGRPRRTRGGLSAIMIGPFIDIRGAIDVHVHSEPDLFPRIDDDTGVCRHAAELGLRAIVLKCHSERTTSRAYLTQQMVPEGIEIYGGIVLNRAVGGLNPAAVEAALQLGGKQVWMPTVDAA